MSMRGSGGEGTAAKGEGDNTIISCTSKSSKEQDNITKPLASSPWVSLLEIAPNIYEHEKALLVMKEHDYASAPRNTPLLHFVTNCQSPQHDNDPGTDGDCQSRPTRRTVKDLLLNCRRDLLNTRQQLARKDTNSLMGYLREVITVQVLLIHEQQEQLHGKEKELASVRKEKEQLQARLDRMERRLSILQRRGDKDKVGDSEGPEPSTPAAATTPSARALPEDAMPFASPSSSQECTQDTAFRPLPPEATTTTTSTPVCNLEQPVEATSRQQSRKSAKRQLKTDSEVVARENKLVKRKTQKPNHVRTAAGYRSLGLPAPQLPANSTSTLAPIPSLSAESAEKASEVIAVPSWNLYSGSSSITMQDSNVTEDTSDETFLRRHKKLEDDEKKRKRWDLQRSRTIKEHQDLLQRYLMKSGGTQVKEKKREKVTSFAPHLEQLEAIEVMDSVAVSAFGRPIPLLEPREFELPWFNPDKKEVTRVRRSRGRPRHSVGNTS